MVREGLSDKRTFVQRGHMLRFGEERSRPGNSKCKGPEVGGNGLGQFKAIVEAVANGAGREWEARSEANGPAGPGGLRLFL